MTRVQFVAVLAIGMLTLLSSGCGDLGGGLITAVDELGFDSGKLCDPGGGGFGNHRILTLQVGEARELTIPGLEPVDPNDDDFVAIEPSGPDRLIVYAQYPGYKSMQFHRRGEKDLIVELRVWWAGPASFKAINRAIPRGDQIGVKRSGDELVVDGYAFTYYDYVLLESVATRFPEIRCEVRLNPNALKLLNEGDQLAEYLGEEQDVASW